MSGFIVLILYLKASFLEDKCLEQQTRYNLQDTELLIQQYY